MESKWLLLQLFRMNALTESNQFLINVNIEWTSQFDLSDDIVNIVNISIFLSISLSHTLNRTEEAIVDVNF